MTRPKLLMVAPTTSFFLSHRLPIALAAIETGYRVALASPDGPDTPRLVASGVSHFPIPLERAVATPAVEIATLAALSTIMRRERPHIAHLITAKPALYGGLAARFHGVPAIAAITGLGYLFIRSDAKASLARKILLSGYKIGLDHRANHFIFQNGDDLELFRSHGLMRKAGCTLIPGSGADLNVLTPRPLPDGPVTVVLPARMLRDKGIGEFVEAAGMLHAKGLEARFRLVGDPDPSNPASLSLEELHQIHAQRIVEWQPFERDIATVLAASHVVVLPSYREGLPKTLIDAAAAGRATVTNDLTGCRDAILPNVTGLLCKPRDAASLANAIETLIKNRAMIEEFGKAGRKLAERRFDIRQVVTTHLALYEQLRRQD